jgi:uncharacterized protein (DUF433 family)
MTTPKRIELTKYLDFSNPDAIRIKGHRLGIEHILDYYLEGHNPDEIAQEFPGLNLETIYAVIIYYLTNRTKMDAYLLQRRTLNEQAYQEWAAAPSPLIQRLRAVREERSKYK